MSDDIDWSKIEGISSEDTDHKKDSTKEESKQRRSSRQARGLGRGLDALFGDDDEQDSASSVQSPGETSRQNTDSEVDERLARKTLGIDQLSPNPDQPRKKFNQDSLHELANSLVRHGVLQPLLVRPRYDGEDGYEIIAGERRWRACQLARIHEVPVIIHDLGDEQTLEIALIENLQREDLNPIDEALGYQRLMEQFDKSQSQLAKSLGKSRSHIANMVRLVNLPDEVQAMLRDGVLSPGHARTLINAGEPLAVARKIVSDNLSVREAEALATQSGATKSRAQSKGPGKRAEQKSKSSSGSTKKDIDTQVLEDEISNMLGMKVSIDMRGKGGALSVEFGDLDDLDDLLHRLTHGARPSQSEE